MLSPTKLRELRRSPLRGANKLKQAIALAETTQVAVAEGVGVPQSQVSEDAAGKYAVLSIDKARAYAAFFGCTVDDLFPPAEAVAS